jgi:hypothetical protein
VSNSRHLNKGLPKEERYNGSPSSLKPAPSCRIHQKDPGKSSPTFRPFSSLANNRLRERPSATRSTSLAVSNGRVAQIREHNICYGNRLFRKHRVTGIFEFDQASPMLKLILERSTICRWRQAVS